MSIEPLSKEKEGTTPGSVATAYVLEAAPTECGDPTSPVEIDPNASAIEKSLVRKLDLRILPMAGFAYFLLFLDRSNIGEYQALLHVYVHRFDGCRGFSQATPGSLVSRKTSA
jgi:hypothetical protein